MSRRCHYGNRAVKRHVAKIAILADAIFRRWLHTPRMTSPGELHRHLSAWRDSKGLSQEQVANILGVNKSTVHRWETGKRAMDLTDLKRLSEIYKVDPAALLLSPSDHDLARRLSVALDVLRDATPEIADRWLQVGADMARPTLPKSQHDC